MAAIKGPHPGLLQPLRVGAPLIAQRIELRGVNRRRWKMTDIGGPKRRDPWVGTVGVHGQVVLEIVLERVAIDQVPFAKLRRDSLSAAKSMIGHKRN